MPEKPSFFEWLSYAYIEMLSARQWINVYDPNLPRWLREVGPDYMWWLRYFDQMEAQHA